MFYDFYSEDVKNKIIDMRDKLLESKSLPSENEMGQEYKTFQKRFGLDVLAGLKGEELIETIFNVSNRDSLAYWLEFKKDDTFKTRT
jgi:5-methylcytosine-specific restriction protein B